MMLLMVIFMITAPMMQGGVDVTLPKAEARPLEPKSGLVVTVDRSGADLRRRCPADLLDSSHPASRRWRSDEEGEACICEPTIVSRTAQW